MTEENISDQQLNISKDDEREVHHEFNSDDEKEVLELFNTLLKEKEININIEERIIKIIYDHLCTSTISDIQVIKCNSNLCKDLGADSLDRIEIIMECEEQFDIKLPDEEFDIIETVQDIINCINNHIKNNNNINESFNK